MAPHYFFLEKPDWGRGVVTVTHLMPESEFSPLGRPRPFPEGPHRTLPAARGGGLLVFAHLLTHEWDAQRGDYTKATQVGSDSASPALPHPSCGAPMVLGSCLPPANFPGSDATGRCAASLGSLPQGSKRGLKSRKAIGRAALLPPWGQGLPGSTRSLQRAQCCPHSWSSSQPVT